MFWSVIASLLVPGFGQALVHRRVRAGVWFAAAVLTLFGVVWSVWFYPVSLIVHVASAIDAWWWLRRDSRPGGNDRAAAAVVFALGAIAMGGARMFVVEAFKIPSSSMYPTLIIGDHLFVDKLTKAWKPIQRGEVVVFKYPCEPSRAYVERVVAVGGDTVEVRCDVLYVNGNAVASSFVRQDAYQDHDETNGSWFPKHVARYRETLDGHTYDVYYDPGRPTRDAGKQPATASLRDFPVIDAPWPPSCAQTESLGAGPTREAHGTLVQTKQGANACEPQRHYVVPKGALFGLGDNRYNANDSRIWGGFSEDDVVGRVVGIWMSDGAEGGWGRVGAVR